MGKLTDQRVIELNRPRLYGDGETLYVKVSPRGTKSWVQRITSKRQRRDLGLGPFPRVCVAEARKLAAGNRQAVRHGRDILEEKRRQNTVPTFEQAARRVYESYRPTWTNASHAAGWIQTLERHAFPKLGKMRVDRILRRDVLETLEPICRSCRRHREGFGNASVRF